MNLRLEHVKENLFWSPVTKRHYLKIDGRYHRGELTV
jgi:hypothetical protein